MKKLRFLALLFVISTSAMFAQDAPAASSGKATVYFYRIREAYGALLKPSVFCDGSEVGRMRNGRFFSVQVDAGRHNITSGLKGNGASVEMKVGETYYFKVDISKPGLFHSGRGEITEIFPDQGKFEVSQLKPAKQGDLGVSKPKEEDE